MKQLFPSIFVISIVFSSCSNNKSETIGNTNSPDTLVMFKQFIAKFNPLKYPFVASTDCYYPDSNGVKFDPANDSIFIESSALNIPVGLLPDTADFYPVIYAAPTVCYLLILATYSKDGRLISEEQVSNGCGSDCGYTCSDDLTINSLQDITIVNNIEFFECDSAANETPGTWQKIIEIKKCSVDKNGNIKSEVSTTKETKKEAVKIDDPIKVVERIFNQYIKFQESTDSPSNKDSMKVCLTELQKSFKENDLPLLIDVWMYYDPTDFPTRGLISPIFYSNREKSLKAINSRLANKKEWERDDTAPYSDLILLKKKIESYSEK